MAPARNSAVRRGSRKRNETPHGTWLDGAWKGGLWFCYARSLAWKQKIGILDTKTEADSLGEEQLGKLREEENEDKESAPERRRENINLGLDLGDKDEHVVCHALALALAMTDEACRDAEM